MTRAGGWLVLAACGACGSGAAPPAPETKPAPAPASAGVADAAPAPAKATVDWAACEAALAKAPKTPANRRPMAILDACRVCDGADWQPILEWNNPPIPPNPGPSRAAIEATMLACGYCTPDAKQRFLGTLDDARGTPSRAPWRFLGELCGDRVSAVPDNRFSSAPYYALDRVARAVAARPGGDQQLAGIDLELPALSIAGTGVDLPTSAVIAPNAGPVQMTVTPTELRVGLLPHAALSAKGVVVALGPDPYPGKLVDAKHAGEAVAKLLAKIPEAQPAGSGSGAGKLGTASGTTHAVALLAPKQMRAQPLVGAVAALPGHLVALAVVAHGAPPGWQLPGVVPVPLDTRPDPKAPVFTVGASADAALAAIKAAPNVPRYTLAIAADATVESFATALGALAYRSPTAVSLTLPPK